MIQMHPKDIQIIKSERGTHFDETVVDLFFNSYEEIEEALSKFLQNNSKKVKLLTFLSFVVINYLKIKGKRICLRA